MLGLGASRSSKREHQPDKLKSEALKRPEEAVVAAYGIPATADSVAYEPFQQLLAVATSDGKVKLIGCPGVERTLYSSAKYPYATRQLQFLNNRGVLVRVSKGGFVEAWSLCSGTRGDGGVRQLNIVKARGDKICCIADLTRDPYVLLGCASGCLRIAQLVDGDGNPTSQSRHVRGMELTPYRVRRSELGGEGEVRQLAVQSFGPVHRALVLYTAGMVSVWDLRATQLASSIRPADAAEGTTGPPALAAAGEATAVAWIGTARGDFATGHVDGSVLVWSLPGLDPGEAELVSTLRVVPGGAEPVRMLRCVYGEVDGLMVLGGQEVEQPEGLTLLPLPGGEEEDEGLVNGDVDSTEEEEDGDEDGARARRRRNRAGPRAAPVAAKLPWFGNLIGFCLVPEGGSTTGYEDPAAVLQLVEGGQVVLYSLAERAPHMVPPPFQARGEISAVDAPMVPVHRPTGAPAATMSLSALRRMAAVQEEDEEEGPAMSVFSAGTAPEPSAEATWGVVYCTGYKDGSVCLWDMASGAPRLLGAAPAGDATVPSMLGHPGSDGGGMRASSGGGSGGGSVSSAGPQSVTCISLAWPTGLVISGHSKGEVRVYQWSAAERTADCITLESIGAEGTRRPLHQPAGLQLRLRVRVNSGEVTCLAYCQAIRCIAAGDRSGGVALIDTARPVVRWYSLPAQQAVLAAAIAPVALPPSRARVPEVLGEEGALCHAVFVADSEGCIGALDAARGCFIGRGGELRPKNHSCTLAMELLDEEGCPLWGRQQMGAGCSSAALGAGSAAGRAGGQGSVSEEDSELEDDDEEDVDADEDLSVEEMLARAAAQAQGARDTPARRSREGSGRKPRTGTGARNTSRSGSGKAGGREAREAPAGPAPLAACPDPPAAYVLLATDAYLRVYSAANVVAAERATVAKRQPPARLVYARPLAAGPGRAPGVLALAAAEHGLCVQVYSLPSLDLVHEAPLSASTSWYWDAPPGQLPRLGRLAATARPGTLLLLGPGQELLRLDLAQGLPPPPLPSSLFEPAAAAAALSAAASYEAAHLTGSRLSRASTAAVSGEVSLAAALAAGGPQRGADSTLGAPPDFLDGVDSPAARTEGKRLEKSAAPAAAAAALAAVPRAAAEAAREVAGAAGRGGSVLGGVLSRVGQGLSRAVEGTSKGVRQLASEAQRAAASVQAALIDGAAGAGAGGAEGPAAPRDADWYASLPDLGAVFSRTVPPDEDDSAMARLRKKKGGAGAAAAVTPDDSDDDISLVSLGEEDDGGASRPAPPPRNAAQATAAGSGRRPPPPPPAAAHGQLRGGAGAGGAAADDESAMRSELFGGPRPAARPHASGGGGAGPSRPAAQPGPPQPPRTRTAEEIKRMYSRAPADGGRAGAATARAGDVAAVMSEARSRLEERGERLRRLDDKAADLEGAAAGFADMARQLAERERNKKWWQL